MSKHYSDQSPFFSSALMAELFTYSKFLNFLNKSGRTEAQKLHQKVSPLFIKINWLKSQGIIDGLHYVTPRFHDEPKIIRYFINPIGQSGKTGAGGVGRSFADPYAALGSAFGEVVERISLHKFDPASAISGSLNNLGDSAVPLTDFAGADYKLRMEIERSVLFQKNHAGRRLTFDENTIFRWVEAESLITADKRYLPLQLVSLARSVHSKKEATIRLPLSTGAAAGETLEDAKLAGILEVIERDAYMISWQNQIAGDRLNLESSAALTDVKESFNRYRLELHIISLPTDFDIPVFLSVVIDKTGIGPAVVVGTKAGFDPEEVVLGVATDVIEMRSWLRRNKPASGLPDLSHIHLNNRSYCWWPEERIHDIKPMLQGPTRSLAHFQKQYAESNAAKDTVGRVAFLIEKLRVLKLDAFFVDITADLLRTLQTPAVMVSIPKMQPLYVDECFPYIESERLRSVPKKFGFVPAENPPLYSHPFA